MPIERSGDLFGVVPIGRFTVPISCSPLRWRADVLQVGGGILQPCGFAKHAASEKN